MISLITNHGEQYMPSLESEILNKMHIKLRKLVTSSIANPIVIMAKMWNKLTCALKHDYPILGKHHVSWH